MSTASYAKFFASASKRVQYWLEHHPVASNSILCLNLWMVGDLVAQYSERTLLAMPHNRIPVSEQTETSGEYRLVRGQNPERVSTADSSSDSVGSNSNSDHHPDFDWTRTAQCAGYGAVVTGPLLALWYPFMDRVCLRYKLALRYGPWAAPFAKVAGDEFLMEPPSLVLFFGYMNVCEGGSFSDFANKVRTQFLPSWGTSLAVWPVVLLGTFRYLSVPWQAPVINIGCIAWDAFLSHRNALARHSRLEAEAKSEAGHETPRHKRQE